MTIHVALNHITRYRYDRPVALGPQVVRLRPAPHTRTPVHAYSLKVRPEKHFINWQQDPQSNWLARFVFHEKTRELSIEVDLVAEMSVINPFDFFLEPHAEKFPFEYEPWQLLELAPYLARLPLTPLFKAFLDEIPRAPKPASAAPLTGLTEKCEVEFSHEMRIGRVREAPRVTQPYTEAQWRAIESLGHRVDAALASHDARLTMGGEPTFVSLDDRD